MEIKRTKADSIRLSVFSPVRRDKRSIEHFLELTLTGDLSLGLTAEGETNTVLLSTLTDKQKLAKIYDWIYDHLDGPEQ